jgi:hypothetical protein
LTHDRTFIFGQPRETNAWQTLMGMMKSYIVANAKPLPFEKFHNEHFLHDYDPPQPDVGKTVVTRRDTVIHFPQGIRINWV